MKRWGALLGLLGLMAACSASTTDDGGCKKDTDCATGRICAASGRCEAQSSSSTNPNDPAAGQASQQASPTRDQLACREWRDTRTGCDCKCGTSCLTYQGVDFCGHTCSSSNECRTYMASTFGPGYPYDPYCEDGFCVFSHIDGG